LWQEIWRGRTASIAFVVSLLLTLYLILIFQDALVRRYRLYRAVRLGFLAFTLVGLGWVVGAQLSVVHILTFVDALLAGFRWEQFLLDPLVFIIWGWLAVALLFWGRGVFCGWLCPFGALQELLNEAARKIGIRQVVVPFGLHERLWPLKYILFLVLLAISLNSMTTAFIAAEIEPFKTAITLRFVRDWPFVAFAASLLFLGLFIERFYCRYFCPLGAALAIPARLRMFDWLKRRYQCGRECRICASQCPVQAIHPDGHINPNECIHCLNCQTLYYDPAVCPPLKVRARRRGGEGSASKEVTARV
jgi:polyferredoxin